MKSLFFISFLVTLGSLSSLEYKVQFENKTTRVVYVKMEAGEEIGMHRDAYPRVVIALQGGTITRLESNGTTKEVVFPKGESVFLEADPINEEHSAKNSSAGPIELIIVQQLS